MDVLHNFSSWFWNKDVWLIPGVTWEDLKSTPENGYPDSKELLPMAIIVTIILFLLRYFILEPYVIKPFGHAIGLKEHTLKRFPHSQKMEELFMHCKKIKPSQRQILQVCQEVGWTEKQAERWLRYRKISESPSKMFKFCDSCWNLIYYVFYFSFGLYVLHDKPWFFDIKTCWTNYPFQRVTTDIWWYYMIALGYYTKMCLTIKIQPQRKDSSQMLLHHIVTILLIVFSFTVNMVRAGTLILLIHECADIPLLLAKICGYAGYPSLMDILFIVFILLWIVTRLFLYPFWIMNNALFEVHRLLNTMAPVYYIFNALLILLLLFHMVWTFLIIKIIIKKIKTKEVKDVRSDSEESFGELDQSLSHTEESVYIKKD